MYKVKKYKYLLISNSKFYKKLVTINYSKNGKGKSEYLTSKTAKSGATIFSLLHELQILLMFENPTCNTSPSRPPSQIS